MPAETTMGTGGDGSKWRLRRMASAGMIAVAVVAGAFVQAVSAGFSPIDTGLFLAGSDELLLVSIAAHLVLAAAVPVHRWPRQVLVFAAAFAAMHWLAAALFALGTALAMLGWALYCGLRAPGARSGWRRWAARPPLPVALVIAICGAAIVFVP